MTWGSWDNSGGNGMRIGASVTRTSVKYNSSSVKFTIKWYTENKYTYGDSQQLDFTRGYTGTKSFYNGQGPGKKYRTTTYVTYNYSDYGKKHPSYIKARIPYSYNGSHPTLTLSLWAPARPKPPKPPDPKVPTPREDPLTQGRACVGEDSDGNVRLWYVEPGGDLGWGSFNPATLAAASSGVYSYEGATFLMGAVTVDEDDVLVNSTQIRPNPGSSNDAIILDSNIGKGGAGYHPTLGWHSIASGGSLGRYSDYVPASSNEKAWVKYADGDGSKITKASPASSLLVPANRFLSATLPNPPHGVTTPVIYMGLGSSQPSDSLLKNRLETITARKMLIDPSKPGGPNSPRASSTFLDTGVGSLESQFGGLGLYGNGRITVRDPQAANEAASRSYVDAVSDLPASRIVLMEKTSSMSIADRSQTIVYGWYEDSDSPASRSSLFNYDSGLFTTTVAGIYRVRTYAHWSGSGSGDRRLYFSVNGSIKYAVIGYQDGNSWCDIEMTRLLSLGVGDTFAVIAYQTSGYSKPIDGGGPYSAILQFEWLRPQ